MAPAKGKKKASKATASQSGIIEVDLDEVEESTAYDGDDPTRGFYTFRLLSVADHESQSGNAGIRWMFTLVDDPIYDGWTRSVYSNLETTKWKTEEIMLALAGGAKVKGTKKAKVRLNLNSDADTAKYVKAAALVRGRVQRRKDSDPDDPEMELGKIIPLDPDKQAARKAALAEAEADEDDFEDAEEFEDADDEDDDSDEDDDTEDDDEDSDDDEDDDEEDDDEEEDDEDDDEDEEDEEDEPAPTVKKGKAKATTAKATTTKASSRATTKKAEKAAPAAKVTKGKKAKK